MMEKRIRAITARANRAIPIKPVRATGRVPVGLIPVTAAAAAMSATIHSQVSQVTSEARRVNAS